MVVCMCILYKKANVIVLFFLPLLLKVHINCFETAYYFQVDVLRGYMLCLSVVNLPVLTCVNRGSCPSVWELFVLCDVKPFFLKIKI